MLSPRSSHESSRLFPRRFSLSPFFASKIYSRHGGAQIRAITAECERRCNQKAQILPTKTSKRAEIVVIISQVQIINSRLSRRIHRMCHLYRSRKTDYSALFACQRRSDKMLPNSDCVACRSSRLINTLQESFPKQTD